MQPTKLGLICVKHRLYPINVIEKKNEFSLEKIKV